MKFKELIHLDQKKTYQLGENDVDNTEIPTAKCGVPNCEKTTDNDDRIFVLFLHADDMTEGYQKYYCQDDHLEEMDIVYRSLKLMFKVTE